MAGAVITDDNLHDAGSLSDYEHHRTGPLTLYLGDARRVLAAMPDASVDCVVTSPPFWGLRDYGTGRWTGGDPHCAHAARRRIDGAPQGSVVANTLQ